MTGTALRLHHGHRASAALRGVLTTAIGAEATRRLQVHHLDEHSNAVTKVLLADGRAIVIKRGRHDWARERFAAGRAAAGLLRRRTGIVVPEHLDVPPELEGKPLDAYWWIPLPTLREVWPRMPEKLRPRVLRSWGALARRIHAVRVHGSGRLPQAERKPSSLREFLEGDIGARLLPAVQDIWPAGRTSVEELQRRIPEITARVPGPAGSLLHNDLHMGNVLCRWDGGPPTCVGVIDLEDALAGPPEIDIARLEVLHGRWLGQFLAPFLLDHFHEGYGRALDAALLAFFRAYHLANIGFYAALVGYAEQAEALAQGAREEIARLTRRLGRGIATMLA